MATSDKLLEIQRENNTAQRLSARLFCHALAVLILSIGIICIATTWGILKGMEKNVVIHIQEQKTCAYGWEEYNNHCYFFGNDTDKKSWNKAEKACNQYYGHLVKIEDMMENQWIAKKAGVERSYWIGANDKSRERKWVWSFDLTPLTFQDWAKGEPNGHRLYHEEDCGILNWVGQPQWWDYICYKSLSYICEGDKEEMYLLSLPEKKN